MDLGASPGREEVGRWRGLHGADLTSSTRVLKIAPLILASITVVIRCLWRFPVKFPQENKVFQRPCRMPYYYRRSVRRLPL